MKLELKKLSEREKKLVGILLLVVSSSPLFLLTMPAWHEYTDSKNKISEDKSKLESIEEQIKRLEKLKIENNKLLRNIDDQKKYLAKSHELDFLAQDLKRICDQSSVSLESFTPSAPEPINIILEKQIESETQGSTRGQKSKQSLKEKLKGENFPVDLYRLPIEVKVQGSFTEILELFKQLEKYGRVISVENISIGKVQSKKSGDRLSKSSSVKSTASTATLFGSFDLVAYSLAKEDESLPFSNLDKSSTSTFKFKSKRNK